MQNQVKIVDENRLFSQEVLPQFILEGYHSLTGVVVGLLPYGLFDRVQSMA